MLAAIPASDADADQLVEAADGLTPADIGSAVQAAAAAAFRDVRADRPERRLETADVREALVSTTPTISDEARRRFDEEAARYERA